MNGTTIKRSAAKPNAGQEIITSLQEAIAWAGGEDVPVRLTARPQPIRSC
jgi:hypothetical protein